MSYENLPQNLKEKEIFREWMLEDTKEKRYSKVPYSLVTGNKARVNVPSDFTTLNKVLENLSSFDGITIKNDKDMIAINLNRCVIDEEISDWAIEILEHFLNAYIEYSPSGTGLHILYHYYKNREKIYGYAKDMDDHYVINENEATVVRRIFKEYTSCKSIHDIINGLNNDGILNIRNRMWNRSSLKNIIGNEKYIGTYK